MKTTEESSQEKLQKEILKVLKGRGQGADYAACLEHYTNITTFINTEKVMK